MNVSTEMLLPKDKNTKSKQINKAPIAPPDLTGRNKKLHSLSGWEHNYPHWNKPGGTKRALGSKGARDQLGVVKCEASPLPELQTFTALSLKEEDGRPR